jgi:Ras GTPase-activating protein-binding protein 2
LLSTVDSVESVNGSIVIQVLGELSNDNAPSQKFAQTFFLAMSQSPVGYYVLNNIFRFLKEDVDSDFDDEVEPDSANEIDAPLSHNAPPISDALTNGFHPSSHSVASEEEISGPPSLPTLSVPTPLSPEGRLKPEDLPILPSVNVEIAPEPTAESSDIQSAIAREPAQVKPTATEMKVTIPYQASIVASQPEEVSRSVEPSAGSAPIASAPVVKTWATMAATKPEKMATEPKAGVLTTLSRGNGAQVLPRKEAAKIPSQKGTFWSLLSLITQ